MNQSPLGFHIGDRGGVSTVCIFNMDFKRSLLLDLVLWWFPSERCELAPNLRGGGESLDARIRIGNPRLVDSHGGV